ncbi:MAG: D-alanine--D-alanine ligase, partial [Synechococcus sp.]|nr:D-alanine--D-alanine ligase [Synechococcus sp.]
MPPSPATNPRQPRVVGLVFGGASGEHAVSIRSAATVARGLRSGANAERYTLVPFYIDRQGRWWGEREAQRVLENGQALENNGDPAGFRGLPAGALEVDVWFPVLHGPNGEDGTIQGLFSLMQVPFVGSGVLGSAVGMDKLAMKAAFAAAGLPQGPYRPLLAAELEQGEALLESIEGELGYPCFIKPANLGSSVGISKANNRDELRAGLQLAASHDNRLLVEQGLAVRELECAVLGREHV